MNLMMESCFKHSEELANRSDVNSTDTPFYSWIIDFAKNIYVIELTSAICKCEIGV